MENEISIPASLIDRYEILTPFDEEASVFLVRDRLTKELAVEKKLNYLSIDGLNNTFDNTRHKYG